MSVDIVWNALFIPKIPVHDKTFITIKPVTKPEEVFFWLSKKYPGFNLNSLS
jgi:hypothetical protein